MELIRGLANIRPQHRGCVVTIGNFDGVHLGHQAILGRLAEKAALLGVPAVVVTFEPQPREFFAGGETPARLTRFREKVIALRRYSVDGVLCIRFNHAFAQWSADEFIRRLLVEGLGVRCVIVGDDFHFGKGRQGDINLLKQAGAAHAFQVINMHSFAIDETRVSSTKIRAALQTGDLKTAEKLLGRPYRMCGRVAHGDKLGRKLGFATANIHLHRKAVPLHGVYVVEMFGLDAEPLPGVASVGTRPTVNGKRTLLEVHLFDFNQDIYGRYVEVNFLHKLRDEERYASLDLLAAQIQRDADDAREFFRLAPSK